MSYMEQQMQQQIEAGQAKHDELEYQFGRFCDWFKSIPDADETLVSREYLDDRYNLSSPVVEVSAMWIGWKASQDI